jgi:hypothetical protein
MFFIFSAIFKMAALIFQVGRHLDEPFLQQFSSADNCKTFPKSLKIPAILPFLLIKDGFQI